MIEEKLEINKGVDCLYCEVRRKCTIFFMNNKCFACEGDSLKYKQAEQEAKEGKS
jgi:hypothetical protein